MSSDRPGPTAVGESIDRLRFEVYRPVGSVSAETPGLDIASREIQRYAILQGTSSAQPEFVSDELQLRHFCAQPAAIAARS